jgi:hypothetical protein
MLLACLVKAVLRHICTGILNKRSTVFLLWEVFPKAKTTPATTHRPMAEDKQKDYMENLWE